MADVFHQPSGVYLIHCGVTHAEDYDWEFAETVPHLIVFNAGTRVLFMYPEVVVVLEEDVRDIKRFFSKLQEPPFLIRLPPCQHPARRWVRQVWFKPPKV